MKARIIILLTLLLTISLANASELIAPPVNDECSGAIDLTVNDNFLCGVVTSGTVQDATASSQTSGCLGTTDKDNDDVWFKFVATKTIHRISLLNVSGDETDMYHVLYSGNCGSLTTRVCNNSDITDYSSFVPGETYYIRVFTNSTTNNHNTTFDLCVGSTPSIPSNDECSNATSISLPFSNNIDATNATNNAGSITPTGGTSCSTMNDGVWYTIVGDGNQITVKAQPLTTWDVEIGIYEGSCGSFTCVGGSDTGSPGTVEQVSFNSVNGTTYYINIGHKNDADTPENAFNLDVTSSVLSIDKLIEKGFTYYPNPISNNLSLQAKEEIRHLEVYNAFGQKLRLFSPSELKTNIDLSDLPTGPYFIRAYVGDAVGMFKVIKK